MITALEHKACVLGRETDVVLNGNPKEAPPQKKLHVKDSLAHTVVFVTVVHRVSTDPVQPIGVVVG